MLIGSAEVPTEVSFITLHGRVLRMVGRWDGAPVFREMYSWTVDPATVGPNTSMVPPL